MKQSAALSVFIGVLQLTESLIVSPSPTSFTSTLFASTSSSSSSYSSSSNGSPGGPYTSSSSAWGGTSSTTSGRSTGLPSKTAMESAVNVEWEPMSELERRIEDGIHYEHIPTLEQLAQQRRAKMPGCHASAKAIIDDNEDDDSPRARAVFCGYRYTEDDYNRLKSAKVAD